MLNTTGTKELDKILNVGQPPNVSWGLGYCGIHARKHQSSGTSASSSTIFVRPEPLKVNEPMKIQPAVHAVTIEKKVLRRGCNSCGRQGHITRFCYERSNNIQRAWKIGSCFPEPRSFGRFWVPKSVLYYRKREDDPDDEFDVFAT